MRKHSMPLRTLVPVTRTLLIDRDTALGCFVKLANVPNSFLFESVQGSEKWARYSFVGLPAEEWFSCDNRQWRHYLKGRCIASRQVQDPLSEVEQLLSSFSVEKIEGMPRFTGGLVGYCGYEVSRYVEPKLDALPRRPDTIGTPDICLLLCRDLVVFDNLHGTAIVISHYSDDQSESDAQARLDQIEALLIQPAAPLPALHIKADMADLSFDVSFSEQHYMDAVTRIREYILAGDVFQTVPSQRMSLAFSHDPLQLYRALRYVNPSPYMLYMKFNDFDIVCSSPEVMARLDNGVVTVRPLAGTMPRGADEKEDQRLAEILLADEKEVAEHVMLIDLARNDIGKIARIGSVQVTDKLVIERYSHVMHIVSNVTGQLHEDKHCIDVLRATLPAGTLSGAPKIRAMEIINELEPVKRGVYAGAIGYFDWHGNMDTAIPIRTAVIRNNTLHIQAGSGIVADSDPAREWQETLNKRKAIFRAIGMVLGSKSSKGQ